MPTDPDAGMRRAVVLLSGGLDSAVTLALARAGGLECHCLSLDYGQRHRAELDAARRVAQALAARAHTVVPVDLRALGGSALTADIAVPKDRPEHEVASGIPVTYVPARNMLLLSLGFAMAETIGALEVHIGVNAIDYSGYPDCRPDFLAAFEEAGRLGTAAGARGRQIRICAPLARLSKAQIVRAGSNLGLDFSLTLSCYDPAGDLACGRCDSCRIRRRGFAQAGVPDPTRYAAGASV
ncbi:MAG TPA: 7-cyano-7-deazaguanine synthase QueC [Phycisphaerales bacterium]|nr:7-cyano-7-deazaguanine synthase QueC [Phycisphaerales bacterium]